MKIEFSSQRREMLLFLTTNMAAVTSPANQQLVQWSYLVNNDTTERADTPTNQEKKNQ